MKTVASYERERFKIYVGKPETNNLYLSIKKKGNGDITFYLPVRKEVKQGIAHIYIIYARENNVLGLTVVPNVGASFATMNRGMAFFQKIGNQIRIIGCILASRVY